MNIKTAFGEDAVFLENVTLFGSAGTVAEVQYFVLDSSSITGVGKNNTRVSASLDTPATFNAMTAAH